MAHSKRSIAAGIDELTAMCGLNAAACEQALTASGGDVERALVGLIESGHVGVDDLDPDRVSDELFGLASKRQQAATLSKLIGRVNAFSAMLPDGARRELETEIRNLTTDLSNLRATGVTAKSLVRSKRRQQAMQESPQVLTLPPFPLLTLTLCEWTGTDTFKSWAKFGQKPRSAGKVEVIINRAPADGDDARPVPPTAEMIAAYGHLKQHETEVTAAILAAVLSYINDLLIARYGWDLRPVRDVAALRKMMRIASVHLLPVARENMAYLGLFFHCDWDEEHAGGVLLHGSRVVTVGDHDASWDDAAAMEDGGSEIPAWQVRRQR